MRAVGIDVSFAQNRLDPAVLKEKLDFIMMRAAYGTIQDSKFEQHWEESRDVPFRMVYQYLRSFNIADEFGWEDQAVALMNIVDKVEGAPDAYVVDFETAFNKPSQRFCLWPMKWMKLISEETEAPVLFYTNPKTYQEWLLQYLPRDLRWMNDWDYMCAQYPYKGYDPAVEGVFKIDGGWEPRLPAGQKTWKFWQFSADGNQQGPRFGVIREPWHSVDPAVDIQVFNGTVEDLREYLMFGDHLPVLDDDLELEAIALATLASQIREGADQILMIADNLVR